MCSRPGLQLALAGLLGALCIACGESDRDDAPIVARPPTTPATVIEKQPTDGEDLPTLATNDADTPKPSETQPAPTIAPDSDSDHDREPVDEPLTVTGEEYPQMLDREHPFQRLDRFCVPYPPVTEEVRNVRILVERGDYLSRIAERYEVSIDELIRLNGLTDPNLLFVGQELLIAEEGPVGLGPQAMGRGITEETVTITHLRTRLEELTSLGFGVETGDEVSIFEAFVQIVNEECGGLHGRRIDLRLAEVSALGGVGVDIDTLRNAACLEAAKTIPAVIVLNISGLAGTASQCIAVDNRTAYLSGDPQPSSIIDSADGRVLVDSFTAEQALELMVATAHQAGWLDNRSIAVVLPDTPTQLQSAEVGLIDTLRRFGHDPTIYLVGCDGTVWCRTGLDGAVSKMAAQPPDVIFPALNAVSFPELMTAMDTTGMEKPLIIQSAFSQHGTDAAAELVLRYGGPRAALLYNGAAVISHRDTGRHRLSGYTPPPFGKMCNNEYGRISGRLQADPFQRDDAVYETVVRACAMIRYVARALYDAGPNPTRRDVHEALSLLGDVDAQGMVGGSFGLGKASRPDMVWVLEYEYPCAHGVGYQSSGDEPGGCLIPTSGNRLAG